MNPIPTTLTATLIVSSRFTAMHSLADMPLDEIHFVGNQLTITGNQFWYDAAMFAIAPLIESTEDTIAPKIKSWYADLSIATDDCVNIDYIITHHLQELGYSLDTAMVLCDTYAR